ncbi:helix-turn-helix domain-containing protein [Nonomuraea sp. B1E8]|uniref:helix-turn-helix domain-containing protein n=1 Tax=unclassified Nonomuraea TaxID=2593643 RepID=UPI00325CB36F
MESTLFGDASTGKADMSGEAERVRSHPADWFEVWREQMSKGAGLEVASEFADGFRVSGQETPLGAVDLQVKSFRSAAARRLRGVTIDDRTYQIVLPLRGSLRAWWDGREAEVGAGDLYVHDMARADRYEFSAPHEHGLFEMAVIAFPKILLPRNARHEQVLGQRMSGTEGTGALLKGFIAELANGKGEFSTSERARLGMVLVDLATVLLSCPGGEETIDPRARDRYSLTLQVQRFIQANLADAELSPRSVAAAHHISVSYLHKLFQEQETSVAAWIKMRRLERVRRDLADPSLAEVPIHGIAARWGFPDAAGFSRSFRAAYGMPAKDFRAQALNGGA